MQSSFDKLVQFRYRLCQPTNESVNHSILYNRATSTLNSKSPLSFSLSLAHGLNSRITDQLVSYKSLAVG